MKKVISLILSAAIILIILPVSIHAGGDYEVIGNFNFNGSDSVIPDGITGTEGDVSIDAITYMDDPTYKNVLHLDGSSTVYPSLSYSFDTIQPEGKNVYVETEFDLNTYNLGTAGANITLLFANKVFTLVLSGSSKGGGISRDKLDNEIIANKKPVTQWARYKFVMRLTDENGAPVRKLAGIYADGENMLVDPGAAYDFTESYGNYNKFTIQLSKKDSVYGLCIDNFSIYKYSSDTGVSPVPDKYALSTNLKAVNTRLESGKDAIDTADLIEFQASFDALLDVYLNPEASITDVADALESLGELDEAIKSALSPVTPPDDDDEPSDYTLCGLENFEGTGKGITVDDRNGLTEITGEFSNDLFIGKALKFKNSRDTSVYPTTVFQFAPTPASGSAGAEPGTYVETEFDFNTYLSSGKNVSFYFDDSNVRNMALLVLSGTSLYLNAYNGTLIAALPTVTEWVRLKFVMQMTDENGNDIRQITAIYANGENVIKTPVSFTSGSNYDALRITMSNLKANDPADLEFGVYFDNFSVTSYNALNGNSKAPDRSVLAASARGLLKRLEAGYAEGKYTGEYSSIKGQITQCAQALNDIKSTVSDIAECIDTVNSLDKKLTALNALDGTDDAAYVFDPVLSCDTLQNAGSVSAETYIVTNKNKSLEATLVGVLFKESDLLFGGGIEKLVSKPVSIAPSTSGKVSIDIPLDDYTNEEKETMYIKMFLLSDMKNAKSLTAKVYTFFAEDEVIDSTKYNFNETVNTGMTIIDDTRQKIYITAKINNTANSGSNDVTLIVLKKGLGESALAEGIESSVEFISQSTADGNGYVVFEFIPESGNGDYFYIINGQQLGKAYKGYIYYTDVTAVNDAFADLYKNQTEECLEKYKDMLYINTDIYKKAKSHGISISSILQHVLGNKTYDAYSADAFSNDFSVKLKMVYGMKTAVSTDIIYGLISTHIDSLSNKSILKGLSPADFYKMCGYVLADRAKITDISSLDSVISGAITSVKSENENKNKPTPPSGGSPGSGYVVINTEAETDEDGKPETPMGGMVTFTDTDSVPWANEGITIFAAMDYINGKGDGKFAPDDIITREEFVKMAVNVFGLFNSDAAVSFGDVSTGSWYYRYVASAVSAGIVKGVDADHFGTGSAITREDMATIIYRILDMKNTGLTADGVYIEFNDEFKIAEYAREFVIALAKSGIVNGVGANTFAPKENSTRAQAVKMLYEAYKCL